jgi:hypothetical protein
VTVRERLALRLHDCGVPAREAGRILSSFARRLPVGRMVATLDDPEMMHPPETVGNAWVELRREAGRWLDEHAPGRWYRDSFF